MWQVLRMSGNPLGSLAERAFRAAGLINLQKAYLGNCSLARIDATAFEGLVILIELDLTHNHLRDVLNFFVVYYLPENTKIVVCSNILPYSFLY